MTKEMESVTDFIFLFYRILCHSILFRYLCKAIKNNNMKKTIAMALWACCLVCLGCTGSDSENETEVMLETTAGNIRVKLYNDTPGHRDNFIQNVKDGLYTGVVFHRVIRNFMIQTGDPATRPEGWNPKTNTEGDTITERIPAEIHWPAHFNKRGVLAAARDGDDENPERASDKYQFYIVTGKNCTDDDMDGYETAREQRDAEALFNKKQIANKTKLDALRAARNTNALSDLLEKLQDDARFEVSENPPITYPKDVRKAYKIHGGAPWLDNEYTVFGEVVEGMKAVEAIQRLKTNASDRPLQDIRITKAYIIE
jgi:cyclophilin family peptidyl-prolyl cis-trans isomerase